MPKLVNMKLDVKAREKQIETVAADRPVYPWGLTLTLDEDVLEKLDMDKLPDVDEQRMIVARVTITSVSSNKHSGEKGAHQHRSVSLQVTDLALGPNQSDERDPGKVLYGDGDE